MCVCVCVCVCVCKCVCRRVRGGWGACTLLFCMYVCFVFVCGWVGGSVGGCMCLCVNVMYEYACLFAYKYT